MPPSLFLSLVALAGLAAVAADARAQSVGPPLPSEFRTIDGTGNNLANPSWGSAGVELLRLTTVSYGDGFSTPAGGDRPSAREISTAAANQGMSMANEIRGSDFVWQWGQFLDHDIDLTGSASPLEPFPIPVPIGDPFFDPFGTGTQIIPLNRSLYSGLGPVRQQVNEITAWIDASNVYGSDLTRANELRLLDGTGRLKTSAGNLLPFNVNGFPNAPDPNDPSFFLAGDIRANEQVGLTSMHTLFVREHNFLVGRFSRMFPMLSGEQLYQLARAVVGAEMQAITYNEFLPLLLGPNALSAYTGYNPSVNSGIANSFSTAAYRFGHSMLSPVLLRLMRNGHPIAQGNLALRDAFFAPHRIVNEGGIDPLLRGLAAQIAQRIDPLVVDDVRNFLFGPPGSGGFDLASLNLQRGRDHGLPGYNQARRDFGLPAVTSFAEITSDPILQNRLSMVYGGDVEKVDLWIGGLSEDHVPGALMGELFFTILKNQFERLRDGDRFWYEIHLPSFLVHFVERQKLSAIIRRNTGIGREIERNVFLVR